MPLAGDPTAACAELADLRCFHGVVALCLSAAAEAANRRAEFGSGGAGACAEGEMRSASGPSPGLPEGGAAHGDQRGFGFRRRGRRRRLWRTEAPSADWGERRRFGTKLERVAGLARGVDDFPATGGVPQYACVAIRALALGAVDDRDRSPPGSLGAVCGSSRGGARARLGGDAPARGAGELGGGGGGGAGGGAERGGDGGGGARSRARLRRGESRGARTRARQWDAGFERRSSRSSVAAQRGDGSRRGGDA